LTLRQILDVLWKRKWIIIAILTIAVITAWGYLQVRDVTYESSGTVRMNGAATNAALAGEVGGIETALDADAATSEAVLEPAAASIGETTADLAAAVSVATDATDRFARITFSAVGSTPSQAQARADAVIASYQDYVEAQMSALLTALQDLQRDAIADARDLQEQVAQNPGDSIASTNLAVALGKMTSVTSAIESISNAGTDSTTIVSPTAPGSPTVPSAITVLLIALATGIITGIAVALVRDQFDNRLRGEDEVHRLTGARSIGELGWDRRIASMDPPLPVAHNDRSDLSERIRSLRSNLGVLIPPDGAAFVVTSVEPGDGKSFVSANLALAWARAGKSVVLVGGDLRRPNLARYFDDAADGEGVSDILGEHEVGAHFDESRVISRLNPTRYRRLQILPSGAEPAEPADLMARPAVTDLIRTLRRIADVVIIDSPPALGMADAALMASHTDGAVVIASARRTDRVRLVETVEALHGAGVEVFGIVTNRSRRKLPKTYSSYYLAGQRPADEDDPQPSRRDRRTAVTSPSTSADADGGQALSDERADAATPNELEAEEASPDERARKSPTV
jgi:succinoglycan biosynthesis transport protein ExoP